MGLIIVMLLVLPTGVDGIMRVSFGQREPRSPNQEPLVHLCLTALLHQAGVEQRKAGMLPASTPTSPSCAGLLLTRDFQHDPEPKAEVWTTAKKEVIGFQRESYLE